LTPIKDLKGILTIKMPVKKFCPFCSHRLIRKKVEGRRRLFCEACQNPIYENPLPATCLVVPNGSSRILLVKRSVEPKVGFWCLPGGFMELGETPEEGALRELVEETGLNAEIDRLLGVVATPSAMYQAVVMMGFLVKNSRGKLIAGDDAEETRYFDLNNLPEIAFDSHKTFISRYMKI
jgi:8-oxo-dGTP diphosphatase